MAGNSINKRVENPLFVRKIIAVLSVTSTSTFQTWAIILFSVLGVLVSAASVRSESITIGGTGSSLAVMRLIGEVFSEAYPDTRLEVLPSLGSGGGIKALIDGRIDIAVSARPLKESEAAKPIGANYYGRSPLAMVVFDEPGLDNLAASDVLAIFRGEQTHWPTGQPIRLVLRPSSETDSKLFVAIVDGLDEAYETARQQNGVPTAYNDQENAAALSTISGSLGVMTLSQVLGEGLPIRVLALDGIHPTVANLQSGEYPLSKGYWIVVRDERPGIVERFLELFHSPEGQAILRETGHDVTPITQ